MPDPTEAELWETVDKALSEMFTMADAGEQKPPRGQRMLQAAGAQVCLRQLRERYTQTRTDLPEAELWQRVEHALREAQGDSLAGPGSTTRRGRCFERLTAALDEFHQLQEQYSGECTWTFKIRVHVIGDPHCWDTSCGHSAWYSPGTGNPPVPPPRCYYCGKRIREVEGE